jgi:hypothetical protein
MSQQLSKALFQKKSLKNALVKFKFPSDLEQRHQIIISQRYLSKCFRLLFHYYRWW